MTKISINTTKEAHEKDKQETQTRNSIMKKQMKMWTSFYRRNVHRFVEHYFGIELFFFQKILLYFMNLNTFVMIVAARGISKSWLIAVFACARCVLYPGTKVIIASGQKKQSKLIITEKIEKELMRHANLNREIKQVKSNASEAYVIFHNGSSIEAVTSHDNSRGYRGNILIAEEFRLIDKKILDSVLLPFLNVNRQPPYLKKEKYKHLTEENIELYISSAWYTAHWMWESMQSARDAMMQGKDSVMFALDYLTSLHHGLLSKKRVENIKSSRTYDAVNFQMEYENIMYGQDGNAIFKLEDMTKNRKLKNPFYPIHNLDYHRLKKKRKEELKSGEVRILGVDIALMGGDQNDATIISCVRLIPHGNSYKRKLVYMEQMEGNHSDEQAIRIKQIFEDFQASYIALDTQGVGLSVYDSLTQIQYDEERDVEYEAWSAYNDETMSRRVKSKNPLPVIYSIKAGVKLNHEIVTSLRSNLQNGNVELPINEIEARDMLSDKAWYQKGSVETKVDYEMPYVQTTLMVNEMVNLNHEISGGYIKVKEKRGKRKDRYSSFAYANYLAKILEEEKLSDEEVKMSDFMFFMKSGFK